MGDIVGWLFVLLMVFGFGYALVWQVRDMLAIRRTSKWKTQHDKRKLVGHYLTVVSFAGFFVSYLLNVVAGLLIFMRPDAVQHALINSNSTSLACFLFLVVFFVAKFGIMPKKEKHPPLLKTKF